MIGKDLISDTKVLNPKLAPLSVTRIFLFSLTITPSTYNGAKRINNTSENPIAYQLANYSPSYILMNTQITKTFGENFPMDVYIGAENLSNYFQSNPILADALPAMSHNDLQIHCTIDLSVFKVIDGNRNINSTSNKTNKSAIT